MRTCALANLTDLTSLEVTTFTNVEDVKPVDAEGLLLRIKAVARRQSLQPNAHQQYLMALMCVASELAGTSITGFVVPPTGELTEFILTVRNAYDGFANVIIAVYIADPEGLYLV